MTNLEKSLLFIILMPVMFVLNMYIVQHLWAWFLVPLGLHPIGMLHAAGLTTVITFFKGPYETKGKKTEEIISECLGHDLGALLVGYLIHLFM